jgi:hypothetical protein
MRRPRGGNHHVSSSPKTALDDCKSSEDDGATISTRATTTKNASFTNNKKHSCIIETLLVKSRTPLKPSVTLRDDDRIRCRYLYRLGLTKPYEPKMSFSNRNQRHESKSTVETLKGDNGIVDETVTPNSPPLHSAYIAKRRNKEPVVRFQAQVLVHEIPGRADYSMRLKQTMWILKEEFGDLVKRNTVEYWSENCDPNRVVEEDSFINDENKMVHPAHFMPEYKNILRLWQFSVT